MRKIEKNKKKERPELRNLIEDFDYLNYQFSIK